MSNLKLAALAAILIVAPVSIVAYSLVGNSADEEEFDSPRIAALAKELAAGNQPAVAKFWEEMRGKAPLVEPVAGDKNSSWVTFVWRGDNQTRRVDALGGPPTGDFGAKMERLANTDLWFRTDRVPNDARFIYKFRVNAPDKVARDLAVQEADWKANPPRPDPLNSRNLPAEQGSLAELPNAPPEPWLQRIPGVQKGISNLIEGALPMRGVKELTIESEILNQERTFAVYTPPAYDPKGDLCGLLVMFDGNGCQQTTNNPFPVAVILDNLIAEEKIPPLVAVFVYQTEERNKELDCSDSFARFVTQELLPRVKREYRVSPEPSRAIVCGLSLGGLMSAYCGYRHADVFGNVLSLSGSYQQVPGMFAGTAAWDAEPGWLTRQFVSSPRLQVRFFLAAGRFENFHPYSLLGENRRLRDVLLAKGYSVNYREFSGGHDPVGWRGPFVEGLTALAAAASTSDDRRADVLNQLRDAINALYGDDSNRTPRINCGPCARFAVAFREQWNARFQEQVDIALVMTPDKSASGHVALRFADGSYFDGGNGVMSEQNLIALFPDKPIEQMEEFNFNRLRKLVGGLDRPFPLCPNYSDELTRKLIENHLARLASDKSE